jgi:hypothetical protein
MAQDLPFFGSALAIGVGSQPGLAPWHRTAVLTADWRDLDCRFGGRSSLPNIQLCHRI